MLIVNACVCLSSSVSPKLAIKLPKVLSLGRGCSEFQLSCTVNRDGYHVPALAKRTLKGSYDEELCLAGEEP